MASARDIKRKIRTIRGIEQICRAMKTVASIRLHRAEQRLTGAKPYRESMAGLVQLVAGVTKDHPFLEEREVRTTGLVLVTSDRGLAGGYNASAIRQALQVGSPKLTAVIALGRRGLVQMTNRGYPIIDSIVPLGGEPDIAEISGLANRIGQLYLAGELDRVVLVYSRFLGGVRSEARAEVVLPVKTQEPVVTDIIFEPPPPELLPGLMDRYLRSEVLAAVLESSASEHAARVAAMTAATDNAEDMIRELTRRYNKSRQASITKELTEIVSTSEATA